MSLVGGWSRLSESSGLTSTVTSASSRRLFAKSSARALLDKAGDIEYVDEFPFQYRDIFAHVERVGEEFQPGVELVVAVPLRVHQLLELVFGRRELLPVGGDLLPQPRQGGLRGAVNEGGHPHPLKVEGGEDVVDLGRVLRHAEIGAPAVVLLRVERFEDKGLPRVEGELLVAVERQPPEPPLDILAGEELVEIDVELRQVGQDQQRGLVLVDLPLQKVHPFPQGAEPLGKGPVKILVILTAVRRDAGQLVAPHIFRHVLGVEPRGHARVGQLLQRVGVGILLRQRREAADASRRLLRGLGMEIPPVQTAYDDVVEALHIADDVHQRQLGNRHVNPPFLRQTGTGPRRVPPGYLKCPPHRGRPVLRV